MTDVEEWLDPNTLVLQSFVDSHRSEIQQKMNLVGQDILSPIGKLPRKHISNSSAYSAISLSMKRAEAQLRTVYAHHSIDFWFTFLRGLPTILRDEPSEWVIYATLGALKWSNFENDTSFGGQKMGESFTVAFTYSEEDLFLCCRIASISRIIAGLNNTSRSLGKGSRVKHADGDQLVIGLSLHVEKAVESMRSASHRHILPSPLYLTLSQDFERLYVGGYCNLTDMSRQDAAREGV